jgi:hypothetical protein
MGNQNVELWSGLNWLRMEYKGRHLLILKFIL